jgi:hypothetical protein
VCVCWGYLIFLLLAFHTFLKPNGCLYVVVPSCLLFCPPLLYVNDNLHYIRIIHEKECVCWGLWRRVKLNGISKWVSNICILKQSTWNKHTDETQYFSIIKHPQTFFTEVSSPPQRAVTYSAQTAFLYTVPVVLTHTFHARDLCFTPESSILL